MRVSVFASTATDVHSDTTLCEDERQAMSHLRFRRTTKLRDKVARQNCGCDTSKYRKIVAPASAGEAYGAPQSPLLVGRG